MSVLLAFGLGLAELVLIALVLGAAVVVGLILLLATVSRRR